jgi:hypothetical protein
MTSTGNRLFRLPESNREHLLSELSNNIVMFLPFLFKSRAISTPNPVVNEHGPSSLQIQATVPRIYSCHFSSERLLGHGPDDRVTSADD